MEGQQSANRDTTFFLRLYARGKNDYILFVSFQSCATAAMHPYYVVVEGGQGVVRAQGVVGEVWRPTRGWWGRVGNGVSSTANVKTN